MEYITIALLGVSLSMDAFAISLSTGMTQKNLRVYHALKMGAFFGAFQAIMPLIGWFLGSKLLVYIEQYDHWIACVLLSVIGAKMIWDGIKTADEDEDVPDPTQTGRLLVLAFATSVDALCAGISLAVSQVNIYLSVALIGIITFSFSTVGVRIGAKIGPLLKQYATIVGGGMLIAIGLKILIEHLFF